VCFRCGARKRITAIKAFREQMDVVSKMVPAMFQTFVT